MTDTAGASPRASVHPRVLALLERVAPSGLVVEVGGDGTLAVDLAAVGREHVDLPIELVAGRSADPISDVVRDRPVGAVVACDTIGRLGAPDAALARLADVTERLGAVALIVSVPNVAHRDVAVRLLFGRWDPGDHDRFAASGDVLFDHERLDAVARRAGLAEVDRDDQVLASTRSDLELDHPAISPATNLREFLDVLRAGVDDHGTTLRFVRAYRASSPTSGDPAAPTGAAPFCSVVVRTLGHRPSLHDALVSLAAQTDDDFEVVLTVHRSDEADDAGLVAVREAVGAYAPAFASRVRIEPVVGGGRSAALNRAVDVASGRYLAFLDDDDVVTADWIEQFRRAALRAPGRIARTLCVAQPHRRVEDGLVGYEPTGGFETPFARRFDLLEHRHFNQSPICSWAVPLVGLRALGARFDDDLEVCEDWDLLLSVAPVLGVSTVETYTSVYRRFDDAWSASGGVATETWDAAVREVRERHDRTPTLVPAGSILPMSHLRDLLNHLLDAHPNVVGRLEAVERSRYWRLTAPVRWLTSKRPN